MPITKVEPPTRSAGRRTRLSEAELKELGALLKEGWASDQEEVATKSAAYQRAQAAIRALGMTKEAVMTTVYPVDESDPDSPFYWAIRERPAGQRPRGRRRQTPTAEPTAA